MSQPLTVKDRVCYSKAENPTVADAYVVIPLEGDFSCDLTDLEKKTTYYVRAYAVNEYGMYYGAQMAFTTLDDTPIDYMENGVKIGKSIPLPGDWDFDYNPDTDQDAKTPYTVLHWAPVNCGYEATGEVNTDSDHRFGKYYQWGAGDASLYNGTARSFYYDAEPLNGDKPGWQSSLSGSVNDKWNNDRGPCPSGWRLPTMTEYMILCEGRNDHLGWVPAGSTSMYAGQANIYAGSEFFGANLPTTPGTGVFFPASGVLWYDSGRKIDRIDARYGYYWSSRPVDAEKVYTFDIYPYFLSAWTKNYRSYGQTVRCVADPE